RPVANWFQVGNLVQRLQATLDHPPLLVFRRQRARVLVKVAVMPDLVTGGEDFLDRMRVRLDRMAGDEEGGDNSPLREDLENPLNPQNRVFAARSRARGGRAARTDPDRDRVEVECQADGSFGQG